jgi:hypothetical protein
MSNIERWTLWPTFVMPSGVVGEVERCCAIDGPNVPVGEKVEVVRADAFQGAVSDAERGRALVDRMFELPRGPEWEQALAELRVWSMKDHNREGQ